MNTLRCKACESMGCPVEGMTGQCPVCGELFCVGHLNNHEHNIEDVRFADLEVMGVGRVGTYEKAVQSHRWRKRKYWAIGYFDNRTCADKSKYGMRQCSDTPRFKTKIEATNFLA